MVALSFEIVHDTYVTQSWKWMSTECQQYLVLHIGYSRHYADQWAHNRTIYCLYSQNTMHNRRNTDSKIINLADCKTCKKRLLAVEYLFLIINNYPTAKTKPLYKSTDGPTGKPAYNLPNTDELGDFDRTMPQLKVWVYWQPGLPNLSMVWFRAGPWPKVTVQHHCKH